MNFVNVQPSHFPPGAHDYFFCFNENFKLYNGTAIVNKTRNITSIKKSFIYLLDVEVACSDWLSQRIQHLK